MTCKWSYEKVNIYYALVILLPFKNSNGERQSVRKRGRTGARTDLLPYYYAKNETHTVCMCFILCIVRHAVISNLAQSHYSREARGDSGSGVRK